MKYKKCPECGHLCEPKLNECPICYANLIGVPVIEVDESVESSAILTPEPTQEAAPWKLISEDNLVQLPIRNGESFNLGREHTLKEYLARYSNVGRLQAKIYAENNVLKILSLGTTNQIMVDQVIYWASQEAELKHGSRIVLGRRPNDMGGFDDPEKCAFFRVEKTD